MSLFSEKNRLCGIDISHYQGSIPWDRLQNAGIHFAFMKATQGGNATDPCYEANYTSKPITIRRKMALLAASAKWIGSWHFNACRFGSVSRRSESASRFIVSLKAILLSNGNL